MEMTGNYNKENEEHILVCLSTSPSNEKIIRTAARLTGAFRGTMTAVFVETSGFRTALASDKKRLADHIHLAEELGVSRTTLWRMAKRQSELEKKRREQQES